MADKSHFEKKYCDMLIAHMSKGLSFESFGAEIHRGRDTLYRWARRYPEFQEAKQKAEAHCQKWWELRGMEGLTEKGFSAAIWIFNMKNRFKWVDVEKHIIEDGNYSDEEIINAAKGKSA